MRALRLANRDRAPTTLQLIGGEPTLRSDLPELVGDAHALGFGWVHLATNGVVLARDAALAARLASQGLATLYLQFDGLHPYSTQTLRGRADLVELRLQALAHAGAAGIDRNLLVMTVTRDVNHHELADVIDFAVHERATVAGVVFQMMAQVGRQPRPDMPRETLCDFLEDVSEQTQGRLQPADWLPYSLYTPLIRYLLESPLETEPAALVTPDPLCGLHAILIVDDDGTWRPLTHYLDPHVAALGLDARVAAELRPEGGLAALLMAPSGSAVAQHHRLLARQRLAGMLLASVTAASRGFPPDWILRGLRDTGESLLAESLSLLSFLKASRRIVVLVAMDFMDASTYDFQRLRRCVVHYSDGAGVVPFCAMNTIRRRGMRVEGR